MKSYIIPGLPIIKEGDDLALLIEQRFELVDGDILCIASTVVAKSEGRFRFLSDYVPSERAKEIALALGKDARFVQAVLDESDEVLMHEPFLLVVTKFGHTCVNAGIDLSNVGFDRILLLPENPSSSAEKIRERLSRDCAVIVTDTCGRPFRCGVTGTALGCAGIAPLRDWRGEVDIFGRPLELTMEAIADEIAATSNLLMGEGNYETPAIIIRGLKFPKSGGCLFWPKNKDIIHQLLRR
jgi:coenzyme F420-0:L-glutamate ligase/coenzyme F420-1:gamma-L-glutamate ligase